MEIRPFRGWRYRGEAGGEVSSLIAPPYDLLGAEEKQSLLAGSENNIVAVDLPHVPPREVGPARDYRAAAELLGRWQGSGVLIQDEAPCLYAYEQTFAWAGKSYRRRAMLCGVRATELGKDVVPHEHTFEGPKADRLKLTEYTRTQLSPIFGFYSDPAGEVADALWSAAAGPPAAHGTLRDVTEKLWVVSSPDVISAVSSSLWDVPVYIADGHHRYTTAMNYANSLRVGGQIDANHEANFVMFALVARDDPGLKILPTHRIVSGLKGGFSMDSLIKNSPAFSWRRCSVDELDVRDAGAWLHRYGRGAMAMMSADPAEIWIARLSAPQAMLAAAPDHTDAWRSLDVAVLHKLIIDGAIEPWRTDKLFIEYTPDARVVLAACQSSRAQLGICVQPTPLEAVEAIAKTGQAMPHKSTYFYPKLATGMVLKPLY